MPEWGRILLQLTAELEKTPHLAHLAHLVSWTLTLHGTIYCHQTLVPRETLELPSIYPEIRMLALVGDCKTCHRGFLTLLYTPVSEFQASPDAPRDTPTTTR